MRAAPECVSNLSNLLRNPAFGLRVVDEDVELAAGYFGNFGFACCDALGICNL